MENNKTIIDLVKNLPEYFTIDVKDYRKSGIVGYEIIYTVLRDQIYNNIKDIPFDENAPDIYTEQCWGETERFKQANYLANELCSLPYEQSKRMWFYPNNWEKTCDQIKICKESHKIEFRDVDCWRCALTAEFYWEQNEKDEKKHEMHLSKDITFDESCLICKVYKKANKY